VSTNTGKSRIEAGIPPSIEMVVITNTTTKTLKKQYGKVDIDQIERLQDEMGDLMEMGNEIGTKETTSKGYIGAESIILIGRRLLGR
jgi:hypothetical protein